MSVTVRPHLTDAAPWRGVYVAGGVSFETDGVPGAAVGVSVGVMVDGRMLGVSDGLTAGVMVGAGTGVMVGVRAGAGVDVVRRGRSELGGAYVTGRRDTRGTGAGTADTGNRLAGRRLCAPGA